MSVTYIEIYCNDVDQREFTNLPSPGQLDGELDSSVGGNTAGHCTSGGGVTLASHQF